MLNDDGEPITFASQAAAQQPRPARAPHLRQLVQDALGDDPRHGRRRHRAVQRQHAAKAANATPFKRPENGAFRPGLASSREFFFDETGDTNATSPENATAGGWGSVFKLTPGEPDRRHRHALALLQGDAGARRLRQRRVPLAGRVTFVEDAGDTLHGQRNALDSGYVFDVTTATTRTRPTSRCAGSPRAATPRRRSTPRTAASARTTATTRSPASHVSDGDPGAGGILGAKVAATSATASWRWFYTQQHGDNIT